jgi:glutathionylspermidine synthase
MTAAAPSGYDALARRIVDEGTIGDPWIDGVPRFGEDPCVLDAKTARWLSRAGELAAVAWDEVGRVVTDDERLLDDFFGLTPAQKAMWLASRPRWHGIARADVFLTADGPQIAELNCDTPTGQAETVVLASLLTAETPGAASLADPSRELEARWGAMVEAYLARTLDPEAAARRVAGVVYPTELTDDLPLVRIYRRWLEARGFRVVLGSPYNLSRRGNDLALFDEPISLMLRHYKTDWWGERESAWDDEQIADPVPLVEPLTAALEAELDGRCAIVNPFGAVLPQNKRAMALMWEHVHRFSTAAQDAIRKYVPPTFRAEAMHREQLLAQREAWVLKSDYGAEGDEVVVGKLVTDEIWAESLAHARPGRWIVQQYFEAATGVSGVSGVSGSPGESEEIANHGVWLVGGVASGIYTRLSTGATDPDARSVATFVRS